MQGEEEVHAQCKLNLKQSDKELIPLHWSRESVLCSHSLTHTQFLVFKIPVITHSSSPSSITSPICIPYQALPYFTFFLPHLTQWVSLSPLQLLPSFTSLIVSTLFLFHSFHPLLSLVSPSLLPLPPFLHLNRCRSVSE